MCNSFCVFRPERWLACSVECTFPILISRYPALLLRDAFSGKEKPSDGVCKSAHQADYGEIFGVILVTSDVYLGTIC